MINKVVQEVVSRLDESILPKFQSDWEEAEKNLKVKSVTISSDYKNPLQIDYSSKGGSLAIEYEVDTDKMPIIQILAVANRLAHYQSFMIDGIITSNEYQTHKNQMLARLAKLISVYYK